MNLKALFKEAFASLPFVCVVAIGNTGSSKVVSD
jgi:hypothetical protein